MPTMSWFGRMWIPSNSIVTRTPYLSTVTDTGVVVGQTIPAA